MNAPTELNSDEVLRIRLEVLRREHRDLDEAIAALELNARPDQLSSDQREQGPFVGSGCPQER